CAPEHFSDPLHGQVGHLFRIRTFGKSLAEKMKFRKPPQISALLLAVNTLSTYVQQKQNEQENNYQPREHRAWKEAKRKVTHRSHFRSEGGPQPSPPVPLRVR